MEYFIGRRGQIILAILLVSWLFLGCKNKRVEALYAKPKALGKVLELGVVMPDSAWQGRQGGFVREQAGKTGIYTCLHILPEDTIHFVGLHRNLLRILPTATGKTRLLDQRAFGQTTQYIEADSAQLVTALAYVWQHEKKRLRDYTFAFEEHKLTVLERWVGKHYPFRMRILPIFHVWKRAPDMLWLKTDRGVEKHIYIIATPKGQKKNLPTVYTAKQFDELTIWREGYQISFFTRKEKDAKKSIAQRLEMEALLETFEVKGKLFET